MALHRQARTVTNTQLIQALKACKTLRHPLRNTIIVLLSLKAGLRAGEIAKLEWSMLLNAEGQITNTLYLPGSITKYGRARRIPLHPELKKQLHKLGRSTELSGPVIVSERGCAMTAKSIVNWFHNLYKLTELQGCSSHSGRRTFVTQAARLVHKSGGSLRDVQLLAGHQSIVTTQRYIDGDSDAQHRLIKLL